MYLFKIGITHGDINGIGYEMLLKVLQDPEMLEFCTPVIFGSAHVVRNTAYAMGINMIPITVVPDASQAIEGRINLVPVCSDAEPDLQFGQQTEASVQAEANSLTAALEAYDNGYIDALVTLPGHLDNDDTSHALTDFIRRALSSNVASFDWIINDDLRVVRLLPLDVTTELGEGLASEAFQSDIKAVSACLRFDFGLMRPRIAVVSAQEKLRDDLSELHEQGITAFGPLASAAFLEGAWQNHYDGCCFLGEDDAFRRVISSKDAEYSIGYISGLPLVLTYPFVGISYELAGRGEASEVPLRQAIYTAIDILRNRIRYSYATHHPLAKQWIPRGRDDYKLDLTKEE
ncbi:MAG: 4-hydroxythreonine-4-phosphate dehydrogenase PdxA [Bacteroidales bacterium]|nr:4-hydroxythreonine-4-phosphate dehydrogenase PdxA [Bacteroidales bacterium]